NAVARRGHTITVYTSAPASKFRKNWPAVKLKFVPEVAGILSTLTGMKFSGAVYEQSNILYDRLAAMRVAKHDILAAGSTGCLYPGLAMQRQGGKFVVDRACPYAPFQQQLVLNEAEKAGGGFRPDEAWFLERQLQEYEKADLILSPSYYSSRTFPENLK